MRCKQRNVNLLPVSGLLDFYCTTKDLGNQLVDVVWLRVKSTMFFDSEPERTVADKAKLSKLGNVD